MVGMGGVRGDALDSGLAALLPNVLNGGERGPEKNKPPNVQRSLLNRPISIMIPDK